MLQRTDGARGPEFVRIPSSGFGLGIDRFTALLSGAENLRDVVFFPLMRPEGEIGIAEMLRKAEADAGTGV